MLNIQEVCDVFSVYEENVKFNQHLEIEFSCNITINHITCQFPVMYNKTIYDYRISKVKNLKISDIDIHKFYIPNHIESLELFKYNIKDFSFLKNKNIYQLILTSCKLENDFKGLEEGLKILILNSTYSKNIKNLPKSLDVLWNQGLIPEQKEYDINDIEFLNSLKNTNFKTLGNLC